MNNQNLAQNSNSQTQKRNKTRVFVFCIFMGAVTTLAAVSVYFPKFLMWYFEPPAQMGVSCKESVAWAMQKIVMAQSYGVLGGAVLGLFLGFWLNKKLSS